MTTSLDRTGPGPIITIDDSRSIAAVLSGLADPIRIQILQLLLPAPLCVGDLARELGLPMVNTSHHLKVMRRSGLLNHVKKGRLVMYFLNPELYGVPDETNPGGHLKVGLWEVRLDAAKARPAKAAE